MSRRKKATEFRSVADMQRVPIEKLAGFCEDLRLWLSLHRLAEREGLHPKTPDVFGWIDDGKHDLRVKITYVTEPAQSADAVATPSDEGKADPSRIGTDPQGERR